MQPASAPMKTLCILALLFAASAADTCVENWGPCELGSCCSPDTKTGVEYTCYEQNEWFAQCRPTGQCQEDDWTCRVLDQVATQLAPDPVIEDISVTFNVSVSIPQPGTTTAVLTSPQPFTTPTPSPFCGESCPQWNVRSVRVRTGLWVDQITFQYEEGEDNVLGPFSGGQKDDFVLEEGEVIVRIERRVGSCTDGFRLHTNRGRESQWYGGHGGHAGSDLVASEHDPIVGLTVAAEVCYYGGLGRLTGIVRLSEAGGQGCVSCDAQLQQQQQISRQMRDPGTTTAVLTSPQPFTTPTPSPFCGESCPQWNVRSVRVRTGLWVDQITFQYEEGEDNVLGPFSGGQKDDFVLEEGEVIVRIERRVGSCTDGFRLHTNRGRESQWYGGHGGHAGSDLVASEHDPIVGLTVAAEVCYYGGLGRLTGIVRLSEAGGQGCVSCDAQLQQQQQISRQMRDPTAAVSQR